MEKKINGLVNQMKTLVSQDEFDIDEYVSTMQEKYYSEKEILEALLDDIEFLEECKNDKGLREMCLSSFQDELVLLKATSIHPTYEGVKGAKLGKR